MSAVLVVSILTGSAEPVLPAQSGDPPPASRVSILTGSRRAGATSMRTGSDRILRVRVSILTGSAEPVLRSVCEAIGACRCLHFDRSELVAGLARFTGHGANLLGKWTRAWGSRHALPLDQRGKRDARRASPTRTAG